MPKLELDHLSIFTTVDAPEAERLKELGLHGFGGVTKHGDFGTASTSFFFSNTYLELFWAHDAAQTERSVQAAGIDVPARMHWRETGTAPFGVMLATEAEPPFATTSLRAGWMPGEVLLRFAGQISAEPYYAAIPQPLWYNTFKLNIPEPQHPLGIKTLTHIHITITQEPSAIAKQLMAAGLLTFERGPAPLMTLTFDNGVQGQTVDVRPTLPLVLKV